jgi:nucleotide-binding universal stress UspA family protein
MKVLLAVDGSAYGDAAVNEVAKRPWPAGTTIKVLSSVEPYIFPGSEAWIMPEGIYEESETVERNRAEAAIGKAAEILQRAHGASLEITTEIREGHAAAVILDEAESWGADLIIVGSHGYRGFKRFLLGSVSHAVATHAKCSVAIVRMPAA